MVDSLFSSGGVHLHSGLTGGSESRREESPTPSILYPAYVGPDHIVHTRFSRDPPENTELGTSTR
jgi:hypothetical protein